MIETIYLERDVRDHFRSRQIMGRFPDARVVECERYGEIFNRKAQDFRAQKLRPSLILAGKAGRFVLPAPAGYGVGGARHYYFSHMLNCLYDCRYCFLQGMYRSAHYVLFVNFEAFAEEIDLMSAQSDGETWFFSGYDCDSLALEPVTGFVSFMLERFPEHSKTFLELRTKSTQIRPLLGVAPRSNWVVAFSLSPDSVARALEHKAPSPVRRVAAMRRLQQAGWSVGLRIDPMVMYDGWESDYREFARWVFAQLDGSALHSVSLGGFRAPKSFFDKMVRLYPAEPLFAGPLVDSNGVIGYPPPMAKQMSEFMIGEMAGYVARERVFVCND